MKRLTEIRLMVQNWKYQRDMTDSEIKNDYVTMLSEIDRLQGIVNIVNTAVSGEYKNIESTEQPSDSGSRIKV